MTNEELIRRKQEMMEVFRRGGLRKIAELEEDHRFCRHPEHNPPGHIVLSPGHYQYTCPGCGETVCFKVPEVMFSSPTLTLEKVGMLDVVD